MSWGGNGEGGWVWGSGSRNDRYVCHNIRFLKLASPRTGLGAFSSLAEHRPNGITTLCQFGSLQNALSSEAAPLANSSCIYDSKGSHSVSIHATLKAQPIIHTPTPKYTSIHANSLPSPQLKALGLQLSWAASDLKPFRRGTMSGCHCARNVIAAEHRIRNLLLEKVNGVRGEKRTPHDIATCERKDQ